MKSFSALNFKEKMEYIGILAIYPLILLYEQIGKSLKFLNSRSKQMTASILTVCLMLTMVPVMAFTASAAVGRSAEISYALGTPYKYTAGDGATSLKYGTTSPKDSTAVYSIEGNKVSLGTTKDIDAISTNFKLIYVPVMVTVTVPANMAEYEVEHSVRVFAKRHVEHTPATATANAAIYYFGETADTSEQITFYPYYDNGESKQDTDVREFVMMSQGKTLITTQSFVDTFYKKITYVNNSDTEKQITSYFGVMVAIQNATEYKNTMTGDFTFNSTVTKEATGYDLYVAGVQASSANAGDILGDGAASYNAKTHTLTVSGDIAATDGARAISNKGTNTLNINVTDNATILADSAIAIGASEISGGLNISVAEGKTLTVQSGTTYGAIYAADGVTVSGGTLNVTGTNKYAIQSGGKLTVSDGTILYATGNTAAIYAGGGVDITELVATGSTSYNAVESACTEQVSFNTNTFKLGEVNAKTVVIKSSIPDYYITLDDGVVYKNNNQVVLDGADYGITVSGNETDGYTYTFTNVDFSTSAREAFRIHDTKPATIVLVGENKITLTTAIDNMTYAINSSASLIIKGDGSLVATGADSTTRMAFGISTNQDFTVESGSVTAIAGSGKNMSVGLYVQGTLTVTGGSVLGIGDRQGIYATTSSVDGCALTGSDNKDGTDATTITDLASTEKVWMKVEVPVHNHSWSNDFTVNETHHWHECTADGCEVTENSGKDGYAAHKTSGLCDCGGVVINENNFPDANFRTYLTDTLGKGGDDGFFTAVELAKVTYISVNNMSIASLEGIGYFTRLSTLYCSGNALTSLDLSNNSALVSLYCFSNKLTSLDISNLASLKTLLCSSNKLVTLDASNNTKLETLQCESNELTSLNVSNTALKSLSCYNNKLVTLDASGLTALTNLSCYTNELTSLNVSNTALKFLHCYENKLTNLDVSGLTALSTLYCYKNELASLDISSNTALDTLICDNNKLASLDASNNTALKLLYCDSNELTSLDVSGNAALTSLLCDDNNLTSLNVSKNTALEVLLCNHNKLTSLDLSKNAALKTLHCQYNNLTSLDLSNNTNISTFNGRGQTASITIDQKTMTFDMSTLDSDFDGSKATVTTESCSFNGNILTIKEGVSKVAYTYATENGTNTLSVILTVTNPHTHAALADDGNCLTAVLCSCDKVMVEARSEHTSTGNNVATYTKKPVCDVCSTEYGEKLVDSIAPTGEIKIKNNGWKQFWNTVTFGLFCKDYVEIEITAEDNELGVAKIEYYLSDTAISDTEIGNITGWQTYTEKINITANDKRFVYAKITDNAGNVTYLSVNGGIVVFTDTEVTTGEYEYTLTTKADIVTNIKPGNNTVDMIDICEPGGNVVDMLDYFINSDGYIVSKGESLENFTKDWYAGDYTVTVMYNALGETYVDGTSKGDKITDTVITLTVKRFKVEKPAADSTAFTYNGSEQTYTVAESEYYTVTGNKRTNAGEQDVTVALKDTNTYEWADGTTDNLTFKFNIGKKKVTSPTIDGKVYTGEVQVADVAENEFYTVTTNLGGKNVATYDVVLTLKDGANYKWDATEGVDGDKITLKFNITKATNEWTENPAIEGWTYGGTVKAPTGKGKFIEGDYGIAYYDKDKNPIGNPSDAGEYYAEIFVTPTDNFTGLSSGYLSFTIEKADLTITAKDHSITYGDEPSNNGVEYSGFVNGEEANVLDGTLGFEYSYAQYGNVGDTYTITPKDLTAANYEITFVPGKLTVNPLEAEIEWSTLSDGDLVYDGNANTLTATVKNKKNNDDVAFEIRLSGDNKNVTADGFYYTVTGLTGDKADNYKLGSELQSPTYKVTKADPTVTWPNALVGNAGDKLSTVALESGFTWDNADTVIVYSDNNYGMTYTPADTNNYNILKKDIKVNGLDVTFPIGEITLKDNKWNEFLNNITFGLFFKETQSITITAADTESGVKEIAYYLATEELSIDDVKALESSKWTVYTDAFNVEPDNKYVVYARITDNAGNVIYINSDGIVLDSIKPVIAGVEDGKDVYGDATFTVDEDYLDTVTLDGEPIEVKDGKYSVPADNKEHTIVVTDKTGNAVTYKLTVYKNYKVSFVVDGKEISSGEVGYGKDATLPEIPAKDGYSAKWDVDGKNITADTVITAVYEKIPQSPQTGDNTNIWLWVAVMFVSGLSLFGILISKKNEE